MPARVTVHAARQSVAAHRRGAHDGEPAYETCRVCRQGLETFLRYGQVADPEQADPITAAKGWSEAELREAFGR